MTNPNKQTRHNIERFKDAGYRIVDKTKAGERTQTLKFYREDETGDYLAIEPSTNSYYLDNFKEDKFEGRATAIANDVNSVCTTAISRRFLDADCSEVKQSEVPQEWLDAIGV